MDDFGRVLVIPCAEILRQYNARSYRKTHEKSDYKVCERSCCSYCGNVYFTGIPFVSYDYKVSGVIEKL